MGVLVTLLIAGKLGSCLGSISRILASCAQPMLAMRVNAMPTAKPRNKERVGVGARGDVW